MIEIQRLREEKKGMGTETETDKVKRNDEENMKLWKIEAPCKPKIKESERTNTTTLDIQKHQILHSSQSQIRVS